MTAEARGGRAASVCQRSQNAVNALFSPDGAVTALSRTGVTVGRHVGLAVSRSWPSVALQRRPAGCAATVTKLASVRRCLRLPRNSRGRDLVVGDLHGHRSLLEAELARLGFDHRRDRLFSVGDLIDRGPESLATVELIEEPWFFAVLGNHELMLLNYLGYYSSRMHARKSFPTGGGEWIKEALAHRPKAVERAAARIATLSMAIHVEDERPFNVTHGDLHPIGARQESLFTDAAVSVHLADQVTCSRTNIHEAMRSDFMDLSFSHHRVRLSEAPLGRLPVTYVGHSPLRDITVHQSHVYIDQGVCGQFTSKRAAPRPPTVLEHRQFAYWLDGVVTARRRAARELDVCDA